MQAADPATEAEVADAVRDVLARDQEPPSLLAELIEWFTSRAGFDPGGEWVRGVFWVLSAILVVLLLIFLHRAVRVGLGGARRLRDGVDGERGPTIAERVALLRAEAAQARARGELRLALRKQFFALVLGLGGRGDLQFRDAWTNREVLARGDPSAEVDTLLTPLVVELEAKEFGHESVSTADLDRLESLCARYLGDPA